jgi:hypothetical protein
MDIDTTGSKSGGSTSGHSNSRPIDRLPDAILYGRIITSFLDDRDVAVASACCRAWRTNLPIVRLEPPVEIHPHPLTMHGAYHDGDDYFYKLTLPVLISARTRSVTLQGRWCDQGWGNRKGQLAILATSATTTTTSASQREPATLVVPPLPSKQLSYSDLTEEQDNRRLVCLTANVAEHHWQPFTLRFATRTRRDTETYYYHLYMKAGGGGGHVLNLEEVQIFTVIMDEPDRSISRDHRILSDLGV